MFFAVFNRQGTMRDWPGRGGARWGHRPGGEFRQVPAEWLPWKAAGLRLQRHKVPRGVGTVTLAPAPPSPHTPHRWWLSP